MLLTITEDQPGGLPGVIMPLLLITPCLEAELKHPVLIGNKEPCLLEEKELLLPEDSCNDSSETSSLCDSLFTRSLESLGGCTISGEVSSCGKCGPALARTDPEVELYNRALGQLEPAPACTVRRICGKGVALVATRRLYPGDLIISEAPMLTMPGLVWEDSEAATAWLDKRILRLSSQQREVLLCLTDCRHPDLPSYLGLLYTNCMSWNSVDSPDGVCVCPLMARANHSCRPNAEFLAKALEGDHLMRNL